MSSAFGGLFYAGLIFVLVTYAAIEKLTLEVKKTKLGQTETTSISFGAVETGHSAVREHLKPDDPVVIEEAKDPIDEKSTQAMGPFKVIQETKSNPLETSK